jgi:hypothetical protein
MKSGRQQNPLRWLRHGLLLLAAMVVFAAGFLAVTPSAHACLHADHDQPEHQCWLTHYLDQPVLLLAAGQPQPQPGCELFLPAKSGEGFARPFVFPGTFPPRGPPVASPSLA